MFAMIFLGVPYILGWIFKTNLQHQRYMKLLQLKSDMNARLLDRAGAEPSMLELLKSGAQQHLFEVPAIEPQAPAPYMRMLSALQASFLLLAGGAACLWYGQQLPPDRD